MTEPTHPGNSNNIKIEGNARESSKLYQIGHIQANQLFLGNEPAAPLLDRLQQTIKPESVGILKAGDNPKNLAYWQGRVEEIAQLRQWLANENVSLIGIEGIGGTGKSMLATKIYEEIEGFPKRFWADVSSGAILFSDLARRVLTEFGCRVPEEELQLVNALVRCLRLGQYLLVIDNLESLLQSDRQWRSPFYEAFFRAWIESGGGSKILVTTRERPELKGWEWLHLKGLKIAEGAALLREFGIQGEVEAFAELVDGHPLLLTIVANFIKEEYPQDPSLERLADLGLGNLQQLLTDARIVGQHRRENVGMALVLDASFERLADWQQLWLQNLSVYRGSFDAEAAMAMLPQWDESFPVNVEIAEIEQELRKLVKRSFLEEKLNHQRQFTFQLVVLEYLRYQVGDPTAAHQQAIEYYYSKVKEQPWQTIDDLKEYLEIFYHRCQLGEYANADNILSYCDEFLDLRGYYSMIVELNQQLVQNWQPREDEEKEKFGWALMRLGNAHNSLGHYQKAIKYHQQQLQIAHQISNYRSEAYALGNLGKAYDSLGQHWQGIEFYQQQLKIACEIGEQQAEAQALGGLSSGYNFIGQYQLAIKFYQRQLEIAREIGNRRYEAHALGGLSNGYNFFLRQHQQAIKFNEQQLEIARQIGDRQNEVFALGGLSNGYNFLGQYQQAIELSQQHLEIARQIGDRQNEFYALGGLSNGYNSLEQYEQVIELSQQQVKIASEIGDRNGEAASWFNLGLALENVNREADAIGAYRNARQLYQTTKLDTNVQDCEEAIERLSSPPGVAPRQRGWRWIKRLWRWIKRLWRWIKRLWQWICSWLRR